MSNWKNFSRSMRHSSKDGKIMQMCILMAIYIGITVIIAGGDIRKFKRSNGDVVFATIKSTATYSERHGTGRRRHTTITQTANVEFTYNEETHTATVYKPFTKKVGDKIKLGITENGKILVLHLKFDLTFIIITGVFIGFLIVQWMKYANKKEKEQNRNNTIDSYSVKFEDDLYSQQGNDMCNLNKSMLKSEIQTAAMMSEHTNSNQYGNDKEVVDEVPKLKFQLKQSTNDEKDSGQDE